MKRGVASVDAPTVSWDVVSIIECRDKTQGVFHTKQGDIIRRSTKGAVREEAGSVGE